MPDIEILPVGRGNTSLTTPNQDREDDGVTLIADELNAMAQAKWMKNVHQVIAKSLINMATSATTISPVGDTMDDNVARMSALKEMRLILDKRPKGWNINVAVFPSSQGI